MIYHFDLNTIFQCYDLPFIEKASDRMNYNPFRNIKEYFNAEKLSKKVDYFILTPSSELTTNMIIQESY